MQPLIDPDIPQLKDPDVAEPAKKLDTHKLFMENPMETKPDAPGFLKKIEMLSSGVAQGLLEFNGALMEIDRKVMKKALPKGHFIKDVNIGDSYKFWDEKNKKDSKEYDSSIPAAGQFIGENVVTAPFVKPLGWAAQGAQSIGKALPTGLKTLGKYGSSALFGAGVLTGMEGLRTDPDNLDQIVNTETATDAMKNPLTYALPAAATKLATWGTDARNLGEAKELLPNTMARNTRGELNPETGKTTLTGSQKLAHQFFDAFGSLTDHGKSVKLMETIGDDLSKFVTGISGQTRAKNYTELKDLAIKHMQTATKHLKTKEDVLWEQPFKQKIVPNNQDIKDNVISALDLINGSKIDGESVIKTYLQKGIQKDKFTVEDVKQLNSLISDASINARKISKGAGKKLSDDLMVFKDNLMSQVQKAIDPEDMKAFTTASQFSAHKFELMRNSPKIRKAIESEAGAQSLVEDLLSESGKVNKAKGIGLLSEGGHKVLEATKLAEIIRKASSVNGFNIAKFIDETRLDSQLANKLLTNDTYKAIEGLNKVLTSVNYGNKTGWWRQAAVLTGTGAATALGGLVGGPVGAALPIVGYGVASLIANHSPLKTLLHAATKNLPRSTYDKVLENIEKHLTRAGYLISDDGVLRHKEDNDE